MQNTWFTSDPHFWHKNVIDFCQRPFGSIEDMNEGLIVRWNSRVQPGDTVFVLGDFGFCGTTELKKIVPRLNGEKVLVKGNHDWKYKDHRWIEFGFVRVAKDLAMNADVPGGIIRLSHFPYAGSGDHGDYEERYTEHRLVDEGAWLLHGHVHTAWKKKDRMINVGVDVWNYLPVSLAEIEELIKTHQASLRENE